jgi:hypothetical protein
MTKTELMRLSAKLDTFDRCLIVMALEYCILNKQADPIAGGVPYQEHMQHLLTKFLANR